MRRVAVAVVLVLQVLTRPVLHPGLVVMDWPQALQVLQLLALVVVVVMVTPLVLVGLVVVVQAK
jgi:hypothetical protein